MAFKLGEKSLKELQGVKPSLVAVVKRAIEITKQDFAVNDGLRTLEEQKRLLASGATKTLASKHITGDAVDVVPFINGKPRWEWVPIYVVAEAMRAAAKELNIKITWGGCWDIIDFTNTTESPQKMVEGYVARRKKLGKSAFIDGPHFQLV